MAKVATAFSPAWRQDDPEEQERAALAEGVRATNPYNALVPGNLDLANRPRVKNADGSVSTIRSMGANFDGKEMLLPTVSEDGRIMSDDEAAQTYLSSGRNLGQFRNELDSDRAAQQMHEDQARGVIDTGETFKSFLPAKAKAAPPAPARLTEDPGFDRWLAQQQTARQAVPRAAPPAAFAQDAKPTPVMQAGAQELPRKSSGYNPGVGVWLSALGNVIGGLNGRQAPFDTRFWEGQKKAAEDAQQQKIANARADRGLDIAEQRALHSGVDPETLRLREKALELQRDRLGQGAAGQEIQRQRLGIAEGVEGRRAANADPTGDPASQLRDFAYRNGVASGTLDGMSYDAITAMNPEVGVLFRQASPQVAREASAEARKAGATSNARMPYEKERMDYAADIAATADDRRAGLRQTAADRKASGAYIDDSEIEEFNAQHPSLSITSPSVYRRESANPRLLRKRLDDVQAMDRGLAASARLSELARKWSLADAAQNPEAAREAEQEYQLYKDEHQGIILKIAGMSGGGSSGEREAIKDLIPERLNPMAVSRLNGVQKFLHAQAHEMGRVHGIGVVGHEQPAAAESAGEPVGDDQEPKPGVERGDRLLTTQHVPKAPISRSAETRRGGALAPMLDDTGKPRTRGGKPVASVQKGKKNGKTVRVFFFVDGSREVVDG